MKIVIYGIGEVFYKHMELVDWTQVIAIVDKRSEGWSVNGFSVINPSDISNLEYDYIVVFSNKFFLQIQQELVICYNIDIYKIVSWRFYSQDISIPHFLIKQIFNEDIVSVLDVFPSPIFQFYHSKNSISKYLKNLSALLLNKTTQDIYAQTYYYNHIYEKQMPEDTFDLVWLHTPELILLESILQRKIPVLFSLTYDLYKTIPSYYWKELEEKANIYNYSNDTLFVLWIEPEKKHMIQKREKVSFYVMMHKATYPWKCRDYVGLKIGDSDFCWDGLRANVGDNIEFLNSKINECTGLYWIWKNDTSAMVSLNHYRRYFLNNSIESVGNILLPQNAMELLANSDIIFPQTDPLTDCTVLEELKYSLSTEAFQEGLIIITEAINNHCPDYIDSFWSVMKGHYYFHYNMFITRREIMEQYCEWLFSFLIEAAECFDGSKYNAYDQRTIGFFAERMWTVWLYDKDYIIKELPVLFMLQL